jgi:hypothetical protein
MALFPQTKIFRKISSIIIGAIGGFWPGVLGGWLIAGIYFAKIKKVNISGEGSLGVVLLGSLFGLPAGIILCSFISYIKRDSIIWRIIFIALALLTISFFVLRFFGDRIGFYVQLL